MAMLKHLVHLNNAHSRAPLRPKETPRGSGAATVSKAGGRRGQMRGQHFPS
jgi:hypothetical protein